MLFAAIDFPVNFAFYARNNTLLPALVGVFSVLVYAVIAFALVTPLGYLGLVWADTAKHASHALVMVLLLRWRVGALGTGIGRGFAQIVLGAGGMAGLIILLQRFLDGQLASTFLAELIYVATLSIAGLSVYVLVLYALRMTEMRQLVERVSQRLPR